MSNQDAIITALADNERAARELTQQHRDKEPRQREDIVMASWLAEWWYKHVTKKQEKDN